MSNAREISTSYQRDLPAGGSTGQALVKASNTSFDFGFVTLEDVIWANVSDKIGNIVSNVGALTTDNVSEGTNLYFTNSRVRLATIPAVTQLVISTPVFNYNIDQYTGDNPTIYVNAGQTVSFELTQGSSHPFNIRVSNGGANYNTGLTHVDLDGTVSTGASAQGKYTGKLFWKIPHDIGGSTYVYQCSNHSSMVGNIVIQIPQILLTTSNVTEGSNLYFTNTRARQSITVTGSGSYNNATGIITITGGVESVNGLTGNVVLTTANLAESGNLYFTNARARAAVGTATPDTLIYYASNGNFSVNVTAIPGSVTSVNGVSGDVTLTTSNISEGTNQYFTTTRARTSISGGTGITYYSANGVISLPQSVSTSANVSFNNLNLTEQITFPGQGMGDYANIRITDTGGGTSRLQFYVGDNSVDGIDFFVISANNGVRINDYQVWHAGNDGPGSLLNADLLDGLQAASFLQTGTNTDSIGEGSTNLYFTTTRARNSFSAGSGIDITNGVISNTGGGGGGASNLDQLTDVVISSPVNGQVLKYNGTNWVNGTDATGSGGGGTVDSVNGQTGVVVLDTDDIAEATNLYFTTTRARNSFSAGTGVNITSGQISIGQSVATTDNVTFNRVNVGVNGLAFPADAFGGSGDTATITLTTAGGEATRMTFTMTNDADDMFSFVAPSNDGLLMNGNKVWHAGNDGAGTGLDADLLDGQQGSYYASNSYVASLTTSSVSEGSNLYFTNARARASISVTGNASYDSGTGVIYVPPASVQSIPAGYAGALLYSNTKYTFTASNNQTIFVGADNNGQTLVLADPAKTHVFLNGVLLTANTDYRAYQTNVTLLESTAANNILTIVDGLIALDISNVSSHIVPTTSNVYDLGSVTKYWRDLYLSGNTLRLGNVLIKDIGGSVGFSSPTGSSINLTANILNATRITENGSNVVTQADIGTAPGKIPLNQYLGGMAYQNPNSVLIDYLSIYRVGDGTYASNLAETGTKAGFVINPESTNSSAKLNFAKAVGGDTIILQSTNSNNTAQWNIALNPFGGQVSVGTTLTTYGRVTAVQNSYSSFTALSQTNSTSDGVADVTVLRAADLDDSHWANARYDAYSHAWGYGGSATSATAARISGLGDFLVYATSREARGVTLYGTGGNGFYVRTTGTCGYLRTQDGIGGAGYFLTLYTDNTAVGSITTNGTSTTYGTTSDYRLKQNIVPMTGALAKVAQLNPVTYTWKENGSAGQGFIAHELQTVVPDCVHGDTDGVETYTDEEGIEQTRPIYQTVDTSFLVATLTAAIKEQQTLIESLTARIEVLTARIDALE